ncbi:MAG: arginase, partial [Bacteroidota bacterium]
ANIALAEPILRSSHIVSMDLRAIRASEMGLYKNFSPNGFTGREICAIARYAGMSDKVSLFGIYEGENSAQAFQMIAQIIWYFIEGISFRITEFPSSKSEDFTKFTVPTDTEELIFYKSHVTERWWVEVPSILPEHTKTNSVALLPCTEEDYLDACNQNIPERWFKAYRKGFN